MKLVNHTRNQKGDAAKKNPKGKNGFNGSIISCVVVKKKKRNAPRSSNTVGMKTYDRESNRDSNKS